MAQRAEYARVLMWFGNGNYFLNIRRRRAVELGCWFSVGPAMLGSESGKKLVHPDNQLSAQFEMLLSV